MNDLASVLRDLIPDSDYARGALDVLVLLGLVRLEDGQAIPEDNVARMALGSLRAHLADRVTVGLRWDDLDAQLPRGVDILRVIEQVRLSRIDYPTPSRVIVAAQSVVKAQRAQGDLYLMQYDRHAGRYQPVGGKHEPEDIDLAQTLRREMAEELDLPGYPGEQQISLSPIGQRWVETALSATYGVLTEYTFSFFHVTRLGVSLPIDQDTHWLTRAEIDAGRANDGRDISPIYQQALGFDLLDSLPPTMQA